MERGVDLHGVGFHKVACGLEVALALDALDFSQQLAEQFAQFLVVVDADVGLAVMLDHLHHAVLLPLLEAPVGHERAVAHVGFLDVVAWLDADELRHQAVHHVGVVLRFEGVLRGEQAEVKQFFVAHIVEAEEVGTGFLDGAAVGLEGFGASAWEQLARAVAEALVEVGMEVVGDGVVLVDEGTFLVAIDEFLVEAVAVCSFGVGFGEVADGDGLRAVSGAHPVAVGQVDADGR